MFLALYLIRYINVSIISTECSKEDFLEYFMSYPPPILRTLSVSFYSKFSDYCIGDFSACVLVQT